MYCLVRERSSKAGKMSHGFRNLENDPLEPRRGWTTAQIDFEGWREKGRKSHGRRLYVQRMGEAKAEGAFSQWWADESSGNLEGSQGNQGTTRAENQVEATGRGLETLSSVPSNDGCWRTFKKTFLTRAVMWEDLPPDNVHTKCECWKLEGRNAAGGDVISAMGMYGVMGGTVTVERERSCDGSGITGCWLNVRQSRKGSIWDDWGFTVGWLGRWDHRGLRQKTQGTHNVGRPTAHPPPTWQCWLFLPRPWRQPTSLLMVNKSNFPPNY